MNNRWTHRKRWLSAGLLHPLTRQGVRVEPSFGKRFFAMLDVTSWRFLPPMNILAVLIIPLILVPHLAEATDPLARGGFELDQLLTLDLADLSDVQITSGTLTTLDALQAPVFLTTITADMIAITPAKHMLDLIETYVPDAYYTTHIPTVMGFRGIINDRNTKTLLLVNGKPVNNRGHIGATTEIMHWDMNDIARIDVVSGPGSVTYGPGAINGVINIITKSGNHSPGFEMGVNYVSGYESRGVHASYGYRGYDSDLINAAFVYGSLRETDGDDDVNTYEQDSTVSGDFTNFGYATNSAPYLHDAFRKAQLKFHLDVDFLKEWNLWARYTKYQHATYYYPTTPIVDAKGTHVPNRPTGHETYLLSLNNVHKFSEQIQLSTTLDYRRHDYFDYSIHLFGNDTIAWDEGYALWDGFPPGNSIFDYSEREIRGRTMLQTNFLDHYQFALGGEYSFDSYRPNIQPIVNFGNFGASPAAQQKLRTKYKTFDTYHYAVFAEANLAFHPLATVLLSGRLDKAEWSKLGYSPRIALISTLNEQNILRLSVQRSLRIPSVDPLLKAKVSGTSPKNEFLDSVELLYTALPTEKLKFDLSAAYSHTELVGWRFDASGISGSIDSLGKSDIFTTTLAGKWEVNDRFTVGASYALAKQVKFTAANDVNRQFISASDFNDQGLTSVGNDLMSFPRHLLKVQANVQLHDSLTFHTNLTVITGYDGRRDVLKQYDKKFAAEGGVRETQWQAMKADLLNQGYADTDYILNMSMQYRIPFQYMDATLTLFGHNLLENRRYNYAFHSGEGWPLVQSGFLKEPRTFGLSLKINL